MNYIYVFFLFYNQCSQNVAYEAPDLLRVLHANMPQRHKFKWIQEAMVRKENNNLSSVLEP